MDSIRTGYRLFFLLPLSYYLCILPLFPLRAAFPVKLGKETAWFMRAVLCTDVVNYLSLSFVPSFNKYEMFQILHAHTLQEKWLF